MIVTYPTCAIVTVASAPDIAEIHERTPVVLDPVHWKTWLDRSMTDPDAVMRLVREGAVEQFKMHTVSTTVSSSRSSGPECVEPAEFPEMARQGKATYRREQLIWLRTAAAEELQRALFARLEPGALAAARPNRAERRLWLRELADRDDAETFSELVGLIRQGLKQEADLKAATKTEPPRQPGLF